MVNPVLWRRYRRIVVAAVPIGAGIGVALNLAVYLTGNPDYRLQGGFGAFLYTLTVGSAIGATAALCAVLGSIVSLLIWDRRVVRPSRSRTIAGAAGAGIGTLFLWITVGFVNALISPTAWQGFGVVGVIAVLGALIAAATAGTMIRMVEKRFERHEVESHDVTRLH